MNRSVACFALLLLSAVALLLGEPVLAAPPADLALVLAVTGVAEPLAVRHAGDGSNRLFIAGRNGVIRVRLPGQSTALATPFLNLGTNPPPFGLSSNGEGGLLGLAFHPAYESNRRFYISYTDAQGGTVVARYLASAGDANVADAASALVVIRVAQDEVYHNGGDIHFGPDGYLYIARGDGGSQACARSQTLRPAQIVPGPCAQSPRTGFEASGGNLDSRALMGKILRIDVDAATPAGANELCASNADGSANYAIPPVNPFAGTAGTAGNCANTALPILTYTHASNGGPCASVTGGFRYRGSIQGLAGTYVYADYCSGRIHFATQSGASWSSQQWQDGPDLQYATFGEDEAGELYLAELGVGRVLRFSSATAGVLFANGFED